MKNETSVLAPYGAPTGRITRARTAAFRASGALLPLKPSLVKPDKKQVQRGKTKRDENNHAASTATFQNKKRAVLRDVTNVCCESSFKDCINATKAQVKVSQKVKAGPSKAKRLCSDKGSSIASVVPTASNLVLEDKRDEQIQEMAMLESQETGISFNVKEILSAPENVKNFMQRESMCAAGSFELSELNCTKPAKDDFCKDPKGLSLDFIDIDSDLTNPQLCCLYSSDIYTNLRAAELLRRPCSNYMEALQRDITQNMRGVLIDWLVEVSDEYKLVPDTLYLTVYIIDRFLSQNYIERQRLQLLGITSMLIASKYEEICSPCVEEFCSITDNTYTKAEVLKMEIQVLNLLGFQLSVPTIKTFLRRFIRAAHTSYKAPPQALNYLANYLAELALIEYSFLKFLPSAVAASAVFLARWTLEQSHHPWDKTLQHYTCYKASEIKGTVFAMHDLQMNSHNCHLNAVREKYKQPKFESVSAMTSPKPRQSLFS